MSPLAILVPAFLGGLSIGAGLIMAMLDWGGEGLTRGRSVSFPSGFLLSAGVGYLAISILAAVS